MGASLIAQLVKNLPAMQETWVRSLSWEDLLEKGKGNSLQYSCLENPMDGGAWEAAVHGVTKSRTRLSDFTFTFFSLDFKWNHIYNLSYVQDNPWDREL